MAKSLPLAVEASITIVLLKTNLANSHEDDGKPETNKTISDLEQGSLPSRHVVCVMVCKGALIVKVITRRTTLL